MMDMYKSRKAIGISIAMSIIYSLAFIYLLSGFAECIAWFCVILTQLGLIAGAVFAGFLFTDSRARVAAYKINNPKNPNAISKEEEKWQTYYMAACVVLGLLALCFLLCMLCEYDALKIAIDVIDASADFLVETKRIIAVPVLHFVLEVVVILVWVWAFTYVLSLNTIVPNKLVPQGRQI